MEHVIRWFHIVSGAWSKIVEQRAHLGFVLL